MTQFVSESLQYLWLPSDGIRNDIIVSWGHCSLSDWLRNQKEIKPLWSRYHSINYSTRHRVGVLALLFCKQPCGNSFLYNNHTKLRVVPLGNWSECCLELGYLVFENLPQLKQSHNITMWFRGKMVHLWNKSNLSNFRPSQQKTRVSCKTLEIFSFIFKTIHSRFLQVMIPSQVIFLFLSVNISHNKSYLISNVH